MLRLYIYSFPNLLLHASRSTDVPWNQCWLLGTREIECRLMRSLKVNSDLMIYQEVLPPTCPSGPSVGNTEIVLILRKKMKWENPSQGQSCLQMWFKDERVLNQELMKYLWRIHFSYLSTYLPKFFTSVSISDRNILMSWGGEHVHTHFFLWIAYMKTRSSTVLQMLLKSYQCTHLPTRAA